MVTPVLLVGLPIFAVLSIYALRRTRDEYRRLGRVTVFGLLTQLLALGTHGFLTSGAAWSSFIVPPPVRRSVMSAAGLTALIMGLLLLAVGMGALGSLCRWTGFRSDRLATEGVYRWTRNPQIVGYGAVILGNILLWPTLPGLLFGGLFWAFAHPWIRIEEEHLRNVYGESYREYQTRTSRYLGWPRKPGPQAGRSELPCR